MSAGLKFSRLLQNDTIEQLQMGVSTALVYTAL